MFYSGNRPGNNSLMIMTTITLVLFILSGCSQLENKTKNYENKYYGTKIYLPNSLEPIYKYYDTVNFAGKEPTLKIVSFLNGDCGECVMRLVEWQDFFNENISSLRMVEFFLYIHARDYTYLKSIISDLNISFPIIYDSENLFHNKNELPDDLRYQTFLLDSGYRVIYTGNPILSKDIANGYINKINSYLK